MRAVVKSRAILHANVYVSLTKWSPVSHHQKRSKSSWDYVPYCHSEGIAHKHALIDDLFASEKNKTAEKKYLSARNSNRMHIVLPMIGEPV